MKIRSMTAVAVIALAGLTKGGAGVASGGGASLDHTYVANYENVLGTSLELRVHATSRALADRAEQVVLAEIARESNILSSWDPNSEVSRWTNFDCTQGG